jgi:hypothetical protein
MDNPISHALKVKATIEAITKCPQVAITILLKAQGMERTAEAGF